jgi:hypothetical protein
MFCVKKKLWLRGLSSPMKCSLVPSRPGILAGEVILATTVPSRLDLSYVKPLYVHPREAMDARCFISILGRISQPRAAGPVKECI